jgi:hypothetical protein
MEIKDKLSCKLKDEIIWMQLNCFNLCTNTEIKRWQFPVSINKSVSYLISELYVAFRCNHMNNLRITSVLINDEEIQKREAFVSKYLKYGMSNSVRIDCKPIEHLIPYPDLAKLSKLHNLTDTYILLGVVAKKSNVFETYHVFDRTSGYDYTLKILVCNRRITQEDLEGLKKRYTSPQFPPPCKIWTRPITSMKSWVYLLKDFF